MMEKRALSLMDFCGQVLGALDWGKELDLWSISRSAVVTGMLSCLKRQLQRTVVSEG